MSDRCPGCGRILRDDMVLAEDVKPYVEQLVRCYGSGRKAGRAYSERHGLSPNAGERLFTRILNGRVRMVTDTTADRIQVLL